MANLGTEVARGVCSFCGHVAAIVAGLVLMFVGVGMGVSLVALPLAIPVGFIGLLVFIWGMFGYWQKEEPAVQLPDLTKAPAGPPENKVQPVE